VPYWTGVRLVLEWRRMLSERYQCGLSRGRETEWYQLPSLGLLPPQLRKGMQSARCRSSGGMSSALCRYRVYGTRVVPDQSRRCLYGAEKEQLDAIQASVWCPNCVWMVVAVVCRFGTCAFRNGLEWCLNGCQSLPEWTTWWQVCARLLS